MTQTLHLPNFTFIVENKAIITTKGKKLLANISSCKADLVLVSYTRRKETFQCINDTKRHLPYWNPDLTAMKTVQLLYINRG